MSSDEDDLPLAAKLAGRDASTSSPAKHKAAEYGACAAAGKPSSRQPAGQLPLVQFASVPCGPMRLLNQDLLLKIYSRTPRLVIAHSRVCKYFYRILCNASRIDVTLCPETPFRLTSSLMRFVKSSHQKIYLSINDSTALTTLCRVLKRDSSQALVSVFLSLEFSPPFPLAKYRNSYIISIVRLFVFKSEGARFLLFAFYRHFRECPGARAP